MKSDLTDRFDEINTQIKFHTRGIVTMLAEVSANRHNLSREHILQDMTRYLNLPLSMQIEYNLTGWKGYEGIEIPRERNDETSADLQRKLLTMDRMDGKIDDSMAMVYDAQLGIKKVTYMRLQDQSKNNHVLSYGTLCYN